MGARGTGSGVEARQQSIRLRFTWSGQRRYETLDLKPTGPNLRAAQKLVDQINYEIKTGTFVYARHFPESPAAQEPTTLTTFKDYAEHWLGTLTTEFGTTKGYRSSIMKVWVPEIGGKQMGQIKHSDIKVIVAARRGRVSGKTVNNDLIPLRAVFETAALDGVVAQNPTAAIENLPHQSPLPDPFDLDEVAAITGYLAGHSPVPVWAYYETALMTGLRPSEQIIARWGKVDWGQQTLRVDTALTRGREKGTKTNTVRDVDLSPRALAALTAMKPVTFLRGLDEPIFCHPATGRPWTNDQYQRVTYFHPALKKLGIRLRDAYQCRHTFATTALMGGVAPAYIARQLGHVSAAMVFQKYARWIDRADKGREAAKLADLWGKPIGPALAPTKGG